MFAFNSSKVVSIALAVTVLASTGAAKAEPASEVVSYGDLDLAHESGVKMLDRRLQQAVRRVCGEASLTAIQARRLITRCRELTWDNIGPQRSVAIARAGSASRGLALRSSEATIRFAGAN